MHELTLDEQLFLMKNDKYIQDKQNKARTEIGSKQRTNMTLLSDSDFEIN